MTVDNPIRMTRRAFEALPEYTTTIPTGTTPGKRWRRNVYWDGSEWWQGRYGKPFPPGHEHFGEIPIFWRRIIIQGAETRWPRDVYVAPRTYRRPVEVAL